MPNAHVQAAAEGLPTLNRRHLLKVAVGSAAMTIPVLTQAEAEAELTDEQQLDACIASLRSILARMHPASSSIEQTYRRMPDGGFTFHLNGDVSRATWSGPGFYEIREDWSDNYTQILWVEQVWNQMDQCYGFRAYHRENDRQAGISLYFSERSLCIVRKVEV